MSRHMLNEHRCPTAEDAFYDVSVLYPFSAFPVPRVTGWCQVYKEVLAGDAHPGISFPNPVRKALYSCMFSGGLAVRRERHQYISVKRRKFFLRPPTTFEKTMRLCHSHASNRLDLHLI